MSRACVVCKISLAGRHGSRRTCSDACARERDKDRASRYRADHIEEIRAADRERGKKRDRSGRYTDRDRAQNRERWPLVRDQKLSQRRQRRVDASAAVAVLSELAVLDDVPAPSMPAQDVRRRRNPTKRAEQWRRHYFKNRDRILARNRQIAAIRTASISVIRELNLI